MPAIYSHNVKVTDDHIDIQGVGGETLRKKWYDGPSTYLGMFVHGFPNMLMPSGPCAPLSW